MPAALALALILTTAPRLGAQETPSEAEIPPDQWIVGTGIGTLAISGAAEVPLAWIDTAAGGTLVALTPLVARLGGRLETGALGASYTLTIGDVALVLAPGSPALTRDTEILSLSRPVLERDGGLFVPIDLIDRSYGAILGASASWEPVSRRLTVTRPMVRDLPVEVSLVHVQGVTTLVLRLPESLRYRVERGAGVIEIVPIGDRFVAAPVRIAAGEPYVRSVRVAPDRARIELATGVEADDYALRDPFRIVVDLFQPREAPLGLPPSPTQPAARARGIRTVVVDPGHGGDETGAIGPTGTMEKELTLAIARSLAERLRVELGLVVVLTRNDDVTLALDDRSALANQNKADLFLSVHLNSTYGGRAHGAETYFLSLQASDARASELAALENLTGAPAAAPGSEEFDLQLLLWDLAQSRHLESSQRLATIIQGELNRELELPDRGVKQAPFRVLMGAAMPAVLVELGFLSNREEEKRLRDPAYRNQLVGTLVRAVARFKAENERSEPSSVSNEPSTGAGP